MRMRISETTPASSPNQGPYGNWRRTRQGDQVTLARSKAVAKVSTAKVSSAEPRPVEAKAGEGGLCRAWIASSS
jgi:hypothetical protein